MKGNSVLLDMDQADLDHLKPHLITRQAINGERLIAPGTMVENVYFPESAVLTNIVTFADGRAAEAYLVGSAGVGGLAPFLAGIPSSSAVQVKVPGTLHMLATDILVEVVEKSPSLRARLLRLLNEYQATAMVGLGCAVLHSASQRLASFILTVCDRIGVEEVYLTQEEIAASLNVQRTTVNAGATDLKAARAIQYARGKIRVLDRDALRSAACECYRRGFA